MKIQVIADVLEAYLEDLARSGCTTTYGKVATHLNKHCASQSSQNLHVRFRAKDERIEKALKMLTPTGLDTLVTIRGGIPGAGYFNGLALKPGQRSKEWAERLLDLFEKYSSPESAKYSKPKRKRAS